MAENDFFRPEAKKRTGGVIKTIEATTSVEVVVALRHRVTEYRATDVMFGFACACTALAVMWLAPLEFDPKHMPFEMLGAAVIGVGLSAFVAPLRRAMTPRAQATRQVELAARGAFYDLGISKTHRRSGLLVFVALYEGLVVFVPDAAVDRKAVLELGPSRAALEEAVRARDFDAFLQALGAITPPLEKAMPRKAGDENELPDEPE